MINAIASMKRIPTPSCHSCSSRLMGVFCRLESHALAELSAHKTTNTYKKGQVIFYEGNQPFGVFCIFSGRVKLYTTGADGRQQILRLADAGDLLGYRALLSAETYHATAEAIDDAVICCIDAKAFFAALTAHPELAIQVIKKLAHELREAEERMTSIALHSVRERMAELLLLLKEGYGKPAADGIRIDLELSREELAEMMGTTQESAIRQLSDLKKEGVIALQQRTITLLDIPALLTIAKVDV